MARKSKSLMVSGLAAAIVFCAASASAQTLAAGPFTQEQATAGHDAYMTSCAQCHKDDLSGASAPALVGKIFRASWGKHTVADLFAFIKHTMPYCEGGSLSDVDYTDILAFVLEQNGARAGKEPFTPAATAKINDVVPAAAQ